MCQTGGAGYRNGSPKWLEFILQVRWISVANVMAINIIIIKIFHLVMAQKEKLVGVAQLNITSQHHSSSSKFV